MARFETFQQNKAFLTLHCFVRENWKVSTCGWRDRLTNVDEFFVLCFHYINLCFLVVIFQWKSWENLHGYIGLLTRLSKTNHLQKLLFDIIICSISTKPRLICNEKLQCNVMWNVKCLCYSGLQLRTNALLYRIMLISQSFREKNVKCFCQQQFRLKLFLEKELFLSVLHSDVSSYKKYFSFCDLKIQKRCNWI